MDKKRIFIILGIVIAIILVVAVLYFTVFNKVKNPITESDFISKMEAKGFVLEDVIEQFADYSQIDKAYVAQSSDYSYQIEFFVLTNESEATAMFNNNKSIFEQSKTNVSTETSATGKNHAKYTLDTNNMFKVVSQIDNTLMYLDVDTTKKDEVKTILKEFGY